MSEQPNFSLDTSSGYLANTAYFVGTSDRYLLALLCSRAVWWLASGLATQYSGGYFRLFSQYVEQLPIPPANDADRAQLAALAQSAQIAAAARRDEIRRFGHIVLRDLVPGGLDGAGKLPAAWDAAVPDFAAFTAELKKRYKRELTLAERNDWEAAVAQARQQVARHTQEIRGYEREIDSIVQRLFDLTPQEIALIETK